jgi:hypothetical protein
MRRVKTPTLISFSDAARLYPTPSGKGVSGRTIYRHATEGVRGVVLTTVESGGRRYTTAQYVNEFLAAVAAVAKTGRQS